MQNSQKQQASAPVETSVLQQLDANQKRLNAIETEQNSRTSTFAQLDKTLNTLGTRISTNEHAIKKIFQAQLTQGSLIDTIHNKQNFLEGNMIKLCSHFGIAVDKPPDNKEASDMDIDPHSDIDAEMDTLEEEHQNLTPPDPMTQGQTPQTPTAPTGDEGAMAS